MARMSRAGREEAIAKVLIQQYRRKGVAPMTCGEVARRMGMKSSSKLKRIMNDMILFDDCFRLDHDSKYWKIYYKPRTQLPLPERYITINGKQHKVANWVLPSGKELA